MAMYALSHIAVTAHIRDQRQDCRRSMACTLICRLSVGICWLVVDASETRGRWTKLTDLPVMLRNTLTPCRPSAQFRFVAALKLQVAGPVYASEQRDQPVRQTMNLSHGC